MVPKGGIMSEIAEETSTAETATTNAAAPAKQPAINKPDAPTYIRNKIPGADVLGCGFNIFNDYSPGSLLGAIFKNHNTPAMQWVSPASLAAFDVPSNVAIVNDTSVDGSVYVFEDQQEFQQHLAFKAGITASASSFAKAYRGAFSASVSASGSTTDESSVWRSVYEANYRAFRLGLIDQTAAELSPAFANDPDVLALPDGFTSGTAYLFRRVFQRYGTHYVSEVELGGYLHYCATIEKSASLTKGQVSANLSAEFSATFATAKADLSTELSMSAKDWKKSRSVQVRAAGGDTGPLMAVSPAPGEDCTDIFTGWTRSVMLNPSVMNFKLRPLSVLFTGKKAAAVEAAIAAYTNNYLSVSVMAEETGTATEKAYHHGTIITVNGRDITKSPTEVPERKSVGGPSKTSSEIGTSTTESFAKSKAQTNFYVDILNSRSLKLSPSAISMGVITQEYGSYYGAFQNILGFIRTLSADDFVIITGYRIDARFFPHPELAIALRSRGASLKEWLDLRTATPVPKAFNYLFIGRAGLRPGTGIEVVKVLGGPNNSALISRTVGLLPPAGNGGYRLTLPTEG